MNATYSRRANTALMLGIIAVVALAAALLALLAQPEPTTATSVAPVVHAVEQQPLDPFLVELVGPGTDLAPAQAAALLAAADTVCEGFTAGVPVAIMSTTLMNDLNITGTEARDLVNLAATTHCAT